MKGQNALRVIVVVCLLLVLLGGSSPKPANAADFNGDGFDDLAIGVPGEDVGTVASAGAVSVVYGSATDGLTGAGDELWDQDQIAKDSAEEWDEFSKALAAGDFNGDGNFDLAVGVPGEDLTSPAVENGGAVQVMYGVAGNGLDPLDDDLLYQDMTYWHDAPEEDDWFGSALASGDFNGDGNDDLAIGVPNEDLDTLSAAGIVHVIYGTSMGLGDWTERFYQDFLAGDQVAETGDNFGAALTTGDFNGDGFDDLVIGVPKETLEEHDNVFRAGVVHVLYGDHGGLGSGSSQLWHQDGTGDAAPESNDEFGTTLAAGDFNGDGHDDLAVGVPLEDISTVENAGGVHLIYGSADGLADEGSMVIDQSNIGREEINDYFGTSLASGDFNGDSYWDLAVGVPGQDAAVDDCGEVDVFYGLPVGLWSYLGQPWRQGEDGLGGATEADDQFGAAVAAGRFNDDLYADLAIGVPLEDIGDVQSAGAVQVIYGSSGTLSAAGNQVWHQNLVALGGLSEENDYFGSVLVAIPRSTYLLFLPVIVRD